MTALDRKEVKLAKQRVPVVVMTAYKINKSEFSQLFSSTSVAELVKEPFAKAR
jgi:hypothetical protein